jgi:LysR family nod box-dependent transcriptional activator
MNLDRFNLNLFVALEAILSAHSLTEAAKSVYLTQPALSSALKQLRQHYGDELVVYAAGEARLTPLGESLRPRVKALLQDSRDTLKLKLDFDPATASTTFRLIATDILEMIYLRAVVAETIKEAPGVTIESLPFTFQPAEILFRSNVDVAIISDAFASDKLAMMPLLEERLACLVWSGNTAIGDTMTTEQYFAARHAGVTLPQLSRASGTTGAAMLSLGEAQNIAIRASTYTALAHLVIGTPLIATTLHSYAAYCATILPLRVVPLPLPTPPLRFVAQWQTYRSNEPSMLWLLSKLRAISQRPPMQQAA